MQLTDADRNLARVMLEQRLVDQNGLRQLAFQAQQQGLSFQQIVQNAGLWPQQEQGQGLNPRRASSKHVMENSLGHEFGASPNPNQHSTPAAPPETNKVYTTLPSALTVQGVPSSELMKMHTAPTQTPSPAPAPSQSDPSTNHGSSGPTKYGSTAQGSSHGSSAPSTNSGTAQKIGSQNGSSGINNSLADTSSGAIKRVAGELKSLGPYEIVGELGRGAMGIVYKAKHTRLNRTCALKVLIAGEDASESALQRFVSEAQIAVSLDKHPNIVKVLDSGQFDRICYMAMELVEGLSLDSLIKADKVSPKAGARVLADIADALQYAHDNGIIHRDIKPDNILIDRKSISKLNDFGVAKSLEESGGTMTGVVMGTLAYMAPEQAENSKNVDVRSDVYGLGAVLYTIMTKRPPHVGESAANIMASLMTREPPRPSTINKDIDDKLEKICLKALAKKADKRFQTAGAFRDALNAYRKGEFGLLESLVPETANSKANGPDKKVLAIAGVAAALFILMGLIFAFSSSNEETKDPVKGIAKVDDNKDKEPIDTDPEPDAEPKVDPDPKPDPEDNETDEEKAKRLAALSGKRELIKSTKETLDLALSSAPKSTKDFLEAEQTLLKFESTVKNADLKLLVMGAQSKLKTLKAAALKADCDALKAKASSLDPKEVLSQIAKLESFQEGSVPQLAALKTSSEETIRKAAEEAARLAQAQDAEAKKKEAARLAKEAEVQAALEATQKKIKSSVSKATLAWFKARSPKKLLCKTCKGSKLRECRPCGGKGKKKAHSIKGGAATRCKTCDGKGKETCNIGFGGYRKFELTAAFWKVLSPKTKGKINKKSFIASLTSDEASYNIGVSPIVESASITEIVIHSQTIEVTVEVSWDSEKKRHFKSYRSKKNTNIYKMIWKKEGRSYYLSVGLVEGDDLLN